MPQFTAVAFDLDGTLYPNFSLYWRLLPFLCAHGKMMIRFGNARDQIRSEQELDPAAFRKDFYEYQARLTSERLGEQPDQIKKKIEKLVYRGFEPHFLKVRLFPHVKETLDAFSAASLKLGILSDFPPKAKLENMGIAHYWDAILCSEETGALKPAIRPFSALAEALKCPPEQILYVGNSLRYDVAGAKKAGMKTALITGKKNRKNAVPEADFSFKDYRQLRDFVLQ